MWLSKHMNRDFRKRKRNKMRRNFEKNQIFKPETSQNYDKFPRGKGYNFVVFESVIVQCWRHFIFFK